MPVTNATMSARRERQTDPITFHNTKNGKVYTFIRMCVRVSGDYIQVARLIPVKERPCLLMEIFRFSSMERELYRQINTNVPIQWLRQRLIVHIGEDAMDFANLLTIKERKILDDCVCDALYNK